MTTMKARRDRKPRTTKTTSTKSRAPAQRRARVQSGIVAVDPAHIIGHAMLLNVYISTWEGRKHDRAVTADVEAKFHTVAGAGRWNKHLFGGKVKELSAIISSVATMRMVHYQQTLPWTDDGWRIMTTENYFEGMKRIRAVIARFNTAADAFEKAYPRLVREAEEKLNGMFRREDYPDASVVRAKFKIELHFAPLPTGNDFRITQLPAAELARMREEADGRMVDAIGSAMSDAWQRLGDAIMKVRAKLDDGKYLRDSMLDKLRGVAETLGRLNITGDPKLEELRQAVVDKLTVTDAETLGEDDDVRAGVAAEADAILAAMSGLYTPRVQNDDDED